MCTRCCGRVSGYHEQPTTEGDWHYNTNCVTTTFNWDTDKPGGIQSKHAVFFANAWRWQRNPFCSTAWAHKNHVCFTPKKTKKENITQTPRSWHTFRPKWNKLFILGNKRQPLMRKMSQPEGKPAEQHKRLWLMFIIYKLFFDFILCSYNKVCCLLHNNTFLALFYWFAHIQHLYTHTYNVQTPSEAPFRPGITKCPEWSKHRWRALSLSVHWHASWHVSPVPILNMCTTGTKQRQNFVYDIWRIY